MNNIEQLQASLNTAQEATDKLREMAIAGDTIAAELLVKVDHLREVNEFALRKLVSITATITTGIDSWADNCKLPTDRIIKKQVIRDTMSMASRIVDELS